MNTNNKRPQGSDDNDQANTDAVTQQDQEQKQEQQDVHADKRVRLSPKDQKDTSRPPMPARDSSTSSTSSSSSAAPPSSSLVASSSVPNGNPPPPQAQHSSQKGPSGSIQPQHQQPYHHQIKDHAFFGMDIPDDVVRAVSEFLFEHCHHANVEIEAKLGVLIDNGTRQRINLPVRNEVCLTPQGRPTWYRFSSDMTVQQHAHFNKLLNKRLEHTRQPGYRGYQIQYKHTYERDRFFQGPQGKVRVTEDQKTGKIIEGGIVQKERIADLDIFSPNNPFDFRISVNIEVPVAPPAQNSTAQYERNKDRISYRHQNFKIDLTQVKSVMSNNNNNNLQQQYRTPQQIQAAANQDTTHELEIEFVHPEELVRERQQRIRNQSQQQQQQQQPQQPDRFQEVVGWFLNNVRALAKFGGPPSHPSQQQQQQQPQRPM